MLRMAILDKLQLLSYNLLVSSSRKRGSTTTSSELVERMDPRLREDDSKSSIAPKAFCVKFFPKKVEAYPKLALRTLDFFWNYTYSLIRNPHHASTSSA